MSDQSHVINKGLHVVVATPGRLIDMLEKKRFVLNSCKYLCMDEADRMIDLGFEDDVRNIMSFFSVRDPPDRLRFAVFIRAYSDNDKRCYSQRLCPGRSKILRSNR